VMLFNNKTMLSYMTPEKLDAWLRDLK
jgi:hypothetical protein